MKLFFAGMQFVVVIVAFGICCNPNIPSPYFVISSLLLIASAVAAFAVLFEWLKK